MTDNPQDSLPGADFPGSDFPRADLPGNGANNSLSRAIEVFDQTNARRAESHPNHQTKVVPVGNLDPTIYPWQRQAWETFVAFNAFCLYLSMGANRSIMGVARTMDNSNSSKKSSVTNPKNPGHYGVWCSKYQWVARAEAWDSHLVEIRYKSFENKIMEMAERQAEQFVALQKVARDAMDQLTTNNVLPNDWMDILKISDTAAKAERLARGVAEPEPPSSNTGKFDFSKLTSEELDQYMKLHSKLSGNSNNMIINIENPENIDNQNGQNDTNDQNEMNDHVQDEEEEDDNGIDSDTDDGSVYFGDNDDSAIA